MQPTTRHTLLTVLAASMAGAVFVVGTTLSQSAEAKPAKVDICHWDEDEGAYKVVRISERAVAAHLENHGDVLPGSYFVDSDGDGFGDPESAMTACEAPAGYVADDRDCDDEDSTTHPGATEVCGDDLDNDCDSETDEPLVRIREHCSAASDVTHEYCELELHNVQYQLKFGYIEFLDDDVTVDLYHTVDETPLSGTKITVTEDTSVCGLGSAVTDWRNRVEYIELY